MRRGRWGTVFGIAAACLLALGGLGCMRGLLARWEARILSQSGQIRMTEKSVAEADARGGEGASVSGKNDGTADKESKEEGAVSGGYDSAEPSDAQGGLTADALRQVLVRMEEGESETLHEPYGCQLTMREAVEKGWRWTKNFYQSYMDPLSEVHASLLLANLATRTLPEGGGALSEAGEGNLPEEYYGCWTVSYQLDDAGATEVTLYLNAVTGQVLRARVESRMWTAGGLEEDRILDDYAASFTANTSFRKTEEGRRILLLEDGTYYAVLENDSVELYEESRQRVVSEVQESLQLYLTTEVDW